MFDKLGGRKFTLALLSLATIAALLAFGKIDASVFSVDFVTLIGAYFTANVAQKKVQADVRPANA